jgi:hypothetical protein
MPSRALRNVVTVSAFRLNTLREKWLHSYTRLPTLPPSPAQLRERAGMRVPALLSRLRGDCGANKASSLCEDFFNRLLEHRRDPNGGLHNGKLRQITVCGD